MKEIDAAQVEGLSAIGCTVDEIAAVLDCSARLLQRRFVTHMERGRGRMRMSLRRLQMKAAENGNAALLIWLGKQVLNQRDKQEVDMHLTDDRAAAKQILTDWLADNKDNPGATVEEGIRRLSERIPEIAKYGPELASELVQ